MIISCTLFDKYS